MFHNSLKIVTTMNKIKAIHKAFEKVFKDMNKEQDRRLAKGENGYFPYHFVHAKLKELECTILDIVRRD